MRKNTPILLLIILTTISFFIINESTAEESGLVYIIDIRSEIGGGVSTYIKKGIQKLNKYRQML
ncbi:hypothetical protein JT359_12850 [Candidatus Poribacteria bacterium]|nr:hypothetical protein [Candidatus Poribacteria bacterium]